LLAYPCVPKIINLIDNRLFGGSFLPSILVTTNPRYPATISPSLVLNRVELVEIPCLSAGHYTSFLPPSLPLGATALGEPWPPQQPVSVAVCLSSSQSTALSSLLSSLLRHPSISDEVFLSFVL